MVVAKFSALLVPQVERTKVYRVWQQISHARLPFKNILATEAKMRHGMLQSYACIAQEHAGIPCSSADRAPWRTLIFKAMGFKAAVSFL